LEWVETVCHVFRNTVQATKAPRFQGNKRRKEREKKLPWLSGLFQTENKGRPGLRDRDSRPRPRENREKKKKNDPE